MPTEKRKYSFSSKDKFSMSKLFRGRCRMTMEKQHWNISKIHLSVDNSTVEDDRILLVLEFQWKKKVDLFELNFYQPCRISLKYEVCHRYLSLQHNYQKPKNDIFEFHQTKTPSSHCRNIFYWKFACCIRD